MDSLLANYASSDEEQPSSQTKPRKSESKAGEEKVEDFLPKSTSKSSNFFDSLPQPKSSLFTSLPPPKSQPFPNPKPQSQNERDDQVAENSKPKSSSTLLFSSLPRPKSSSSSSSSTKRVVQFRPPTITNPYSASLDAEDEDADEGEEERKRKRSKESLSTATPASFLSSIPAPRHSATLGALPTASGRNRRSVLETEAASSNASTVNDTGSDAFTNPNLEYSNSQSNDMNYAYSSWGSGGENHTYYSGNGADAGVNSNASHFGDQTHETYDHSSSLGGENYAYYGAHPTDINSVGTAGSIAAGMDSNVGSYEAVDYSYTHTDHSGNTQYENNWANATPTPEVSGVVENALSALGQRGRKDIPPEMIVEVKQDELLKNRPREDQVKSTGIAFGPAYQPASTKGKPTKLHKRKHQIGSLFFEMRQKESELAERRSKGFLTKAQTQAKYGW
ncbi:hypothetical protein ACS0TY_015244 [Phlomoides rotata]